MLILPQKGPLSWFCSEADSPSQPRGRPQVAWAIPHEGGCSAAQAPTWTFGNASLLDFSFWFWQRPERCFQVKTSTSLPARSSVVAAVPSRPVPVPAGLTARQELPPYGRLQRLHDVVEAAKAHRAASNRSSAICWLCDIWPVTQPLWTTPFSCTNESNVVRTENLCGSVKHLSYAWHTVREVISHPSILVL